MNKYALLKKLRTSTLLLLREVRPERAWIVDLILRDRVERAAREWVERELGPC